MATDTYTYRRANLRQLVEQWGGPKPLATKCGWGNASFVVQMCGPNPTRAITEKTARRIERALGLSLGWLDDQPGNHARPASVDMHLVHAIIEAVAQTAEDEGVRLSPAKLGDIVALVYSDAESHGNIVRPAHVMSLIKLART